MQIQTELEKINEAHRTKYDVYPIEKQLSVQKKGCLSLIILMIGLMIISFGLIPLGLAFAPDSKDTFMEFILISIVILVIGIVIFVIGLRATRSKKAKDINIHKAFKKLENRYNDLENNLKEVNTQLLDDENTYVASPGLYLSKDWIIILNVVTADCIKTKDIINAFTDYVETRDQTTKIRTRHDRLILLLNNCEVIEYDLDPEKALQVINILKQKNPNIFTSKEVSTKDGQKLLTYKNKERIIDEYNLLVSSKSNSF